MMRVPPSLICSMRIPSASSTTLGSPMAGRKLQTSSFRLVSTSGITDVTCGPLPCVPEGPLSSKNIVATEGLRRANPSGLSAGSPPSSSNSKVLVTDRFRDYRFWLPLLRGGFFQPWYQPGRWCFIASLSLILVPAIEPRSDIGQRVSIKCSIETLRNVSDMRSREYIVQRSKRMLCR